MKKLLALLATVFMVAGLFVGQVFAAEGGAVKVEASTDTLIVGEDTYTITGTIKKVSGRLITTPVDVALFNGAEEIVADTVAIGGKWEITVDADNEMFVPSAWYFIGANLMDTDYYFSEDYDLPEIAYRYDVKLDPLPALKYNATNKIITGKVVNSKGAGVGNKLVEFTLDSYYDDVTRSNGYFVFDLTTVDAAGSIPIVVDGMDTVEVEIAGIPFTKFGAVSSIIHSAYNEDLNIVAKVGDGAVDPLLTLSGVTMADYYGDVADLAHSKTDANGNFTKLVISLSGLNECGFRALSKGTLTIDAVYGEYDEYVGTATVEVKDPEALNLKPDFTDGPMSVDNSGACFDVYVYDQEGNEPATIDWKITGGFFTLCTGVYKGTGVEYNDYLHICCFTPSVGGVATIEVTGYDEEGNKIGTATLNVDVDGYTYTINPTELTVNQKTGVTVVVKNLDGEPVNNAEVTLIQYPGGGDGEVKAFVEFPQYTVSATDTNINNGTYNFTNVVFSSVDDVYVEVYTLDGEWTQMVNDVLPVNGETVYDIELLTTKITAGVATDVTFKVSEDGEPVEGLEEGEIYIDGDNELSISYDAEKEEYTIENAVVTTTDDDVFVEVRTDEQTRVGKTQIEVALPVVTINPDPITNLYKEKVTVTITDPLTGDPLDAYLYFEANDMIVTLTGDKIGYELDEEEADDCHYMLYEEPESRASKYEFNLTIVPADTNGDKKVEPSLKMVGLDTDDAELDIEQEVKMADATLTLDNTNLYIGYPNRVTFLLKNARGEAMKERKIYQGAAEIGVTDENGGLLYSVTPAATGKITFKAGTDVEDEYVTATASAKQDLTGPAITMTLPAETTDANLVVTGTITDDTRVASVYVNNVPVAIIPGTSTTFMYTLALHEGANAISVIALDANGNGSPFVGTVNKVTATPKSVSVTIGKVDTNAGLDVPAYVENGRTMVPLAFIVKTLGGTAEWDSVNNTVKIVLGGKTAVVTIGSNLATVNGVPTTLLATVTARSGRTFVGFTDLAAMLGANTAWDQATMTATFTMP